MLVEFTGFNPTDRMSSDSVVIETSAITSIVASHTGDRQNYTTIIAGNSGVYFVKETVQEVMDKIKG